MQEPDFSQTEQQKQHHSLQQQRGACAKRARPFIVSVPAVVSVVLFDQNLDQKFDPNLDQTLDQNLDQTLGQIWSKTGHFRPGISQGGISKIRFFLIPPSP